MDRRTLSKILAVTALTVGYIVVAALEFHHEVIAPVIVLAIAAILFLPFKRSTGKSRDQPVQGINQGT